MRRPPVDAYDRLLGGDPLLRDISAEAAIAVLTSVKGIGLWTAQMFLIHQLRRPDVLPAGDLGIRRAVQRILRLEGTPTAEEVGVHGRRWAPWRTYAAALLWASLRREGAVV